MAKPTMPDDPLSCFVLLDAPGHLLRRCHQIAVDFYTAEVGEDGPTPPQFALMLTVFQNRGLSQVDLVRLTGIDRSTVAEMVARLLKRGLLQRSRTAADRRTNALAVTETGEAMLRAALPAVLQAQTRALQPVPPARREELVDLLRLLASVNGPAANEGSDQA
jgi:DNA-binding MarR family transcriptional regulator